MVEEPEIGSRWRHLKRGATYIVEGSCVIEALLVTGVIYKSEADGTVWVRPLSEFVDGRFEQIH